MKSHLNEEKYGDGGMVAHHPSNGGKHTIGGLWSRNTWEKNETRFKHNQNWGALYAYMEMSQ
jgi:hypothetical protein